jgi:multidrug efflux system membrane fusion protein
MATNAPESTAVREPHFRTERPVRIQPTRKSSAGWIVLIIVLLAAAVGVWWMFFRPKPTGTETATGQGTGRGAGGREIPVVAATAHEGDLPIYLNGLGTVTPFNLVTVRSRVEGQIMQIAFQEGQDVKENDLLVQIDQRPYQVQLEQAEGQLGRDQAALNNAKVDLERYKSAGTSVSQQVLDTAEATVRQDEAIVQSDQAGIDNAKLNITYCTITAPITGRIGLRKVDLGNMIAANDPNGIAVITQLQPIAVIFSISQDDATPVLRKPNGGVGLQVTIFDSSLTTQLATGFVSAIDNQIDPTTGTVKIKATVENKDRILYPNEFVNARLLVDTVKNATLIPAAAVQRGPDNQFAYVVKKDQTVEVRPLKLGQTSEVTTNDVTQEMTAVAEGLSPGEVVVTDGVDKLQPGAKVAVRERGAGGGRGASTMPSTQPGATPSTGTPGEGGSRHGNHQNAT